jgi:hypothetical protein
MHGVGADLVEMILMRQCLPFAAAILLPVLARDNTLQPIQSAAITLQ